MKPFNLFATLRSIVFALVLAVGLSYAYAWTGPIGVAPTNNTPPPINQGTDDQVKSAGLSLNTLGVFGNAAITGYLDTGTVRLSNVNVAGAACSPNGALSRDASGMALSCASGVWAVTGGGTTPTGLRGIYYPLRGKTISCLSSPTTGWAMVDSNGDIFVRIQSSGWVYGTSLAGSSNAFVSVDTNGVTVHPAFPSSSADCFAPWPAS